MKLVGGKIEKLHFSTTINLQLMTFSLNFQKIKIFFIFLHTGKVHLRFCINLIQRLQKRKALKIQVKLEFGDHLQSFD